MFVFEVKNLNSMVEPQLWTTTQQIMSCLTVREQLWSIQLDGINKKQKLQLLWRPVVKSHQSSVGKWTSLVGFFDDLLDLRIFPIVFIHDDFWHISLRIEKNSFWLMKDDVWKQSQVEKKHTQWRIWIENLFEALKVSFLYFIK